MTYRKLSGGLEPQGGQRSPGEGREAQGSGGKPREVEPGEGRGAQGRAEKLRGRQRSPGEGRGAQEQRICSLS